MQGGGSTWAAPSAVMPHGGLEQPPWARRRTKGAGVVVARFGAHLGSQPPREADGHRIRGGCSRRREVDELDETAPARTMISAPAAKGARGYGTSCGSAQSRVDRLPAHYLCAQEQGMGHADMPTATRMRRGVGLRSCRHGEWHGPCSLRPEDSMSNSLSRRTSCPRRPASSTISTTSAHLQRRR